LDLYSIPTIQIIIEYLYLKYKKRILWYKLPVYVAQLFVYFTTIYLDESKFTTQTDELSGKLILAPVVDHSFFLSNIFTLANLGLTMFSLFTIVMQAKDKAGRESLLNKWFYIEVAFILMNTYVSIGILGQFTTNTEGNQAQREVEALLALLIWTKALYFMQLIDEVAPLVHIIFKVFYDIRYFLVTLVIALFAFANSFYLLGKNQIQYDSIEEDNYPIYTTVIGSIEYVFMMALGEIFADDDNFAKGSSSQELILWIIFLLATFTLIIHLMNMLIAIMGETFSKNNEVADENREREHLKFIMENQWMNPLGDSKSKINYLVTAFLNEEEEEDIEILMDLQDDITEMKYQQSQELDSILTEIKKIKSKVANLQVNN